MNRTKKAISFLMALVLVASATTMFASAATPVVLNSSDWTQMLASINSFDIKGGNAVMQATTQGTTDSTETTVDMYLEKLSGGKWIEVLSFNESADDFYIDASHTRAVSKGYNYRLRTVHTATGPRGTDTNEIISPSLWY